MTQKEMVIKYMEQYGSIEPLTALRELGVYRLSDVILKIRKDRPVETQIKKTTNMWGKPCTYGVYSFPKENRA